MKRELSFGRVIVTLFPFSGGEHLSSDRIASVFLPSIVAASFNPAIEHRCAESRAISMEPESVRWLKQPGARDRLSSSATRYLEPAASKPQGL